MYGSQCSLVARPASGYKFQITEEESIDCFAGWLMRSTSAVWVSNAESLAVDLVAEVDWIITENCYVDKWCSAVMLFVANNKPVFMTECIELLDEFSSACSEASAFGYSMIYRDTGFNSTRNF